MGLLWYVVALLCRENKKWSGYASHIIFDVVYSAKQMFCLYGVLTIDYEQSEQRGFGDIQ